MSQPKRYRHEAQEVCDSLGNVISVGVVSLEHPLGGFVRWDDYSALAAENERLRSSQLSLEKWIACEQIHFETANNLREKLYQASVQIERLRNAGDAMADDLRDCQADDEHPLLVAWLAAKEGRDAK